MMNRASLLIISILASHARADDKCTCDWNQSKRFVEPKPTFGKVCNNDPKSITLAHTSTSPTPLKVIACLQRIDGTWNCEPDRTQICAGTGGMSLYAMPVDFFERNRCKIPTSGSSFDCTPGTIGDGGKKQTTSPPANTVGKCLALPGDPGEFFDKWSNWFTPNTRFPSIDAQILCPSGGTQQGRVRFRNRHDHKVKVLWHGMGMGPGPSKTTELGAGVFTSTNIDAQTNCNRNAYFINITDVIHLDKTFTDIDRNVKGTPDIGAPKQ